MSNLKGFSYVYEDGLYNLCTLNSNNTKEIYVLYGPYYSKESIKILTTKFNAILKPHTEAVLITVWFKNKKDVLSAIEYLEAELVLKKLKED